MQSDCKQIYQLTAERTQKPMQIYKDIGTFVFANLYSSFRRPPSLILKLKGVGFWYLRRQRMEIALEHFPVDYDKSFDDFTSDLGLLKHENKKELHDIFKERLKEYEEYILLRDQVRKKRHETQILLEPFKRED